MSCSVDSRMCWLIGSFYVTPLPRIHSSRHQWLSEKCGRGATSRAISYTLSGASDHYSESFPTHFRAPKSDSRSSQLLCEKMPCLTIKDPLARRSVGEARPVGQSLTHCQGRAT